MYCAFMGDLIGSKSIPPEDRRALQRKIKALLAELNFRYRGGLEAQLRLAEGDAFQGLLKSARPTLDMALLIMRELSPHRIRFAAGTGNLTTELNRDNTFENDGPAYHHAREVMDRQKSEADGYFSIGYRTGGDDYLLDALCELPHAVAAGWTGRQCEAVMAALAEEGVQADVARQLGIDPSSVSRLLRNAGFASFQRGVGWLRRYLAESVDSPQMRPDSAKGLYISALQEMGPRPLEALKLLRQAEAHTPNGSLAFDIQLAMGDAYFALGRYNEAWRAFATADEAVSAHRVDRLRARFGLGRSLLRAGKTDEAAPLLQAALLDSDEATDAVYIALIELDMGVIRRERRAWNDALSTYERAEAYFSASPTGFNQEMLSALYVEISELYWQRGEEDQARHYTEQALRALDRTGRSPLGDTLRIAERLAQSGRPAQAVAVYQRLLDQPGEPRDTKVLRNIYESLAAQYAALGDYAQERAYLKMALRLKG